MANWLCIKCMHEFPDEGVKKQPEYVGMALFMAIGGGLILFAIAGVYTGLIASRSIEVLSISAMALVAGLVAFRLGLQFRKGVKAICPACGRPQGVAADGKIAAEVRRSKQGKG